eukprot:Skav221347  [mRNA]  locus=scaffold1845:137688:140523:- [translate_table: standard]
MLEMLCSEFNADISRTNANHETGLHLAFSTGNEETIAAVADLMWKNVSEKGYLVNEDDEVCDMSPLELGIRSGLLNRECLARIAHSVVVSGLLKGENAQRIASGTASRSACYIASLKLFIAQAPECIPSFLHLWGKREELAEALWPEQTEGRQETPETERITSDDLQKMLRDCPGAGKALMEMCTFRPRDKSNGYNKLPERVSLAPQNSLFRYLRLSHFRWRFKCFYEKDTEWNEEQDWHRPSVQSGCGQRSVGWAEVVGKLKAGTHAEKKEVKILLCRVPDIITPGFFSAVLDARVHDKAALFLFESMPIRAVVSFTFWKGAVWMDLLQFIFSTWGLALLIALTAQAQETPYCPEGRANNADAALLNETLQATGKTAQALCKSQLASVYRSSFGDDDSGEGRQHERAIVADWLIAKGFVDLILEVMQFAGCVATRQMRCYFRVGNLWDVYRSILPILLIGLWWWTPLQILVVLMYWMRLLEGVTLSSKIGHAFLPLQNLVHGLVPAMLFTVLGFCALTHALFAVHQDQDKGKPEPLWPAAIWTTFARLIANELEDSPPANMEMLVLLFGVLFFSVFMMNVFIGVINDQYSEEKKTVRLAFQKLRTQSCLTHLLRMSVIPCDVLTAPLATALQIGCVLACIGIQVAALVDEEYKLPSCAQFFAFFFLQLLTFFASFQCKGCDYPWLTFIRRTSKTTRYLWICQPRDWHMDDDKREENTRSRTRSLHDDVAWAPTTATEIVAGPSAPGPPGPTLLTSTPVAYDGCHPRLA